MVEMEAEIISAELAEKIAGHPIDQSLLEEATHAVHPGTVRGLEEAMEIVEMFQTVKAADAVEEQCDRLGIPPPTVFGIHSLGWEIGFDAQPIGTYGKKPFSFIPPTDISHHDGQLKVGKIDDANTYLGLSGRDDHPYEWEGVPHGHRIAAFPLEVIKELYRRDRERGKKPGIILTYIAGVLQNYPLGVGDIAVMMDDAEAGTSMSPNGGSQKMSEHITQASRFQPKLYRTSTLEYAREWLDLCRRHDIPAGTATVLGTLGSPEFQSFQDMALAHLLFKEAKRMGLLEYVRGIYPQTTLFERARVIFDRTLQPSPILGMGESFEQAAFRRTAVLRDPVSNAVIAAEPELNKIAVALITDYVGPAHANTRHESFDDIGRRTAKRNRLIVEMFAEKITSGAIQIPYPPETESHTYSLKSYFNSL